MDAGSRSSDTASLFGLDTIFCFLFNVATAPSVFCLVRIPLLFLQQQRACPRPLSHTSSRLSHAGVAVSPAGHRQRFSLSTPPRSQRYSTSAFHSRLLADTKANATSAALTCRWAASLFCLAVIDWLSLKLLLILNAPMLSIVPDAWSLESRRRE